MFVEDISKFAIVNIKTAIYYLNKATIIFTTGEWPQQLQHLQLRLPLQSPQRETPEPETPGQRGGGGDLHRDQEAEAGGRDRGQCGGHPGHLEAASAGQ